MTINSTPSSTSTNDNGGNGPCRGSMTMAAENRQSTCAIAKTTEPIEQHVDSIVLLLNERAAAYALAARFDLAVCDAELMQVLAPSSALGYSRAGDVYAQQGKQLLAIEAYSKGLRAVTPSNPGYEQLEKDRAVAQEHWNTKVDLVGALPLDVVRTHILPRILVDKSSFDSNTPSFDLNVLYTFLTVSKTWCKQINQCKAIHFRAAYNQHAPGACRFDRGHRELIYCAPYVTSLQIKPEERSFLIRRMRQPWSSADNDGTSGYPYYAEKIPAFVLLRAHFDSLTDLSIDDRISRTPFVTVLALSWVSNTLTHLDIHCSKLDLNGPLRLCDILTACPHLISLTATGTEPDMSAFPWECPRLKHLKLLSPAFPISNDKLMSIISRLPMIESLKLDYCPGSQGLAAMHAYCPSLKTLHYSTHNIDAFGALRDMQPEEERAAATLHEFRVSGSWSTSYDGSYAADDVFQLLKGYANTLEAFYCHGELKCSNSVSIILQFQGLHRLSRFHRLRHVAFCDGNYNTMQFAIQMFRHVPQLASVSLKGYMVNHETIDALAQLDGLTSLWLDKVDSDVDDSLLCQLLKRSYRLRNVWIVAAYDASERPAWLKSLASMPQIRMLHLELGPCRLHGASYPDDLFTWFIATLVQHCPDIERLELVCTTASFSTRIFSPLVGLTRLKHLVIKASSFAENTLLQLLECSSLARLEIYMSPRLSLPGYVLQRLRYNISKVTYASID